MKIVYITDYFPPHQSGGADTIAFLLATKMQSFGHEVFVITTTRDKNDKKQIEYQGLKIFQIYTDYNVKWRSYITIYNRQTVCEVEKIISQIKPDVVHFHIVHRFLSYACFKVAKKQAKAVFLTAHDMMLVHYDKFREYVNLDDISDQPKVNYQVSTFDLIKHSKKRFNPLRNFAIKYYLRYIDKIFCVSNELKKALETNGIKNIITVHNGIEVGQKNLSDQEIKDFRKKYNLENKKVILFAGRLSGAKGGDNVVAALSRVVKEIPKAILLVAGKKEGFAEEMIKTGEKLGVGEHIIVTGWLKKDEMALCYEVSDLVVVPSVYLDPFPTVNLEAMAYAKPVVGTIFGGTKEVVKDNITGFLVNPLNVEKMSQKIIGLLKNDSLAKALGQAGQKRVHDNFSLEKQAQKIIEWYNKYI